MEQLYRVFRYRTDDPQAGALGTGVTIKDQVVTDDYANAFRDGYMAALEGVGWEIYDQSVLINPAGETWIFSWQSYCVAMCQECGGYVPNWVLDKNDDPFCANCADRTLFVGMGARMDAMGKQYGPYIDNWPTDWETRDLGEQQPESAAQEPAGTITIERTITAEDLCDVLCTAFDGAYGGSNYWLHGLTVGSEARRTGGRKIEYRWEHAAFDGVLVIRTQAEPTDEVGHILSKPKLLKGIERAAREGRVQIREEWTSDVDAEIADVIMQYALFDEIVYG